MTVTPINAQSVKKYIVQYNRAQHWIDDNYYKEKKSSACIIHNVKLFLTDG